MNDEAYGEQFQMLLEERTEKEATLQALRDAIALADARQQVFDGLRARLLFVRTAVFAGYHDEALIHFTWCLGQCDKDERLLKRFQRTITWDFKWILGSIPRYATISKKQIDDTVARMVKVYDQVGLSHRAIYNVRMHIAEHLGRVREIGGYREEWLNAAKDGSQDCAACEASDVVWLHLVLGENERAVEAAAGLIAGGMKCAEEPQSTDGALLVPLFRLGNFELAQRLEGRSYRKIIGQRELCHRMGEVCAFLAATDQVTRGARMMESALTESHFVRRQWDRVMTFRGVAVLLRRLVQVGKKTVKMRLPAAIEFYRADHTYAVAAVLEWVEQQGLSATKQFDARNGNAYATGVWHQYDDLLDNIHPIKPAARKPRGSAAEPAGEPPE